MKTTIISCVILFVFLLYVGYLSITIKPFTAQLPYWHRSLGLFLLILSFIVYNAGEHAKGYLDGLRESERIILELLKKKTE
ncbi:hypothetical protein KQP56_17720 [Bacteroides thetaiotaomicron]|uniref:hypothetical protein n=1 Tax=Bacteroides TaxID=816 RepID=UPI0022222FD8|nr:hypothetical protein [Bacteroides thetaiotaomicron]UYU94456.1 hypothetical protein KQP56_17720 [Bacteroides thetaiotaomicron]